MFILIIKDYHHFSSGMYLSFGISIHFSTPISTYFGLFGIVSGGLSNSVPVILSGTLLLVKLPAVSAVFGLPFLKQS